MPNFNENLKYLPRFAEEEWWKIAACLRKSRDEVRELIVGRPMDHISLEEVDMARDLHDRMYVRLLKDFFQRMEEVPFDWMLTRLGVFWLPKGLDWTPGLGYDWMEYHESMCYLL